MELVMYDFKVRGDERGSLIAIEENRDIPFAIRRIYYIFATREGVRRGLHAHHQLQQVMVCVHGSCRVELDDGSGKVAVLLDDNYRGILLDRMIWHEMYDFSPDCVLMVLASDYYDESDYIRDYSEFTELARITPRMSLRAERLITQISWPRCRSRFHASHSLALNDIVRSLMALHTVTQSERSEVKSL